MKQHNTSEGRKCWNTARERERLRARFQIRERVSSLSTTFEQGLFPEPSVDNLSQQDVELLSKVLSYIRKGDRSKFSLSLIDRHFALLSPCISIDLLQDQVPHSLQLCTAWFGKEYAEMVESYIQSLSSFSLMEYAVWMGKYETVGSLLIGGINPCTRSQYRQTSKKSLDNTSWQQQMAKIGSKVLVRFFHCFPLPLSTYIVKEVIQMRLNAHKTHPKSPQECLTCQRTVPMDFLLQFASCSHWFCEPCFWGDLLCQIDSRESDENTVTCPCCGHSPGADDAAAPPNGPGDQMKELTPAQRREESFRRYQLLPENKQALKLKRGKKKTVSTAASWYAAIVPSLGLTRDVRKDKFFGYIDRNAIQYIRGCLAAGVDLEWRNEYGQTSLYICVWRGYTEVAKLLIEYGADMFVVSNGGSSILAIAKAKGSVDILEYVVERNSSTQPLLSNQEIVPPNVASLANASNREHDPKMILSTLIPTTSDHPGAGSFIIEDAFSSYQVDCLLDLCRCLPLDKSQKKKSTPCSDRSYFCDAEGYVRNIIERAVRQVNLVSTDDTVMAFPYMRFLMYNESGATLAPHVDLCRVDHSSGIRSTHTFIIYLTNNGRSGETSLLGDVSGEGRAEILALVTPARGRLLLFPHACPHEGNEVVNVPKIILRGEVMLSKL